MAELPGQVPSYQGQPGAARVRELLRRCGATQDHAERAALLARLATELDHAADQITASRYDLGVESRELVAGLHAQASMARYMADLERHNRARLAAGGHVAPL